MGQAKLVCSAPPFAVLFDLNPDQISVARTGSNSTFGSGSSGGGKPAGASASIFRKAAPPVISLNRVTFYGSDTKARCDALMNWMSPGGGMAGALIGAAVSLATGGKVNLISKPPRVMFIWGDPINGFDCEGILTSVNVTYTRFTSDGEPVRAEVNIRLQQQPSLLDLIPTNPTSAGLTGRRAHTFSQGDSLARIATEQYGAPGRWRQLAEANGIDDPLRVRPGDRVFLPNPDEHPGTPQ
jgi:nucleoid-associated protein YgaU